MRLLVCDDMFPAMIDLETAKSRGIFVANAPGCEAPVHAACTAEGGSGATQGNGT